MPSPIQGPQFQAQPWQALPVTYPATTQAADPAAGGVVAPVLRGYGTAVTASATSITITLNAATVAGDTIIVVGYTNAGTPGNVTFSGAGATWANGSQGSFIYGIGTAPTAGSTTVTVSYVFAEQFTLLAVSFGSLTTRRFTSTAGDSSTPATVDILKGDPTLALNTVPPGTTATPDAGQSAIFGWYVMGGSVGTATPAFTDTNGSYVQVPVVASGNNVTVEMGYATLPASGGTDHVGNRTDSPTRYEGGVFVFGPLVAARGWVVGAIAMN